MPALTAPFVVPVVHAVNHSCRGSIGPRNGFSQVVVYVILQMSFVVANLLPMLSAILGLVGATFGYTLTFMCVRLVSVLRSFGFHWD